MAGDKRITELVAATVATASDLSEIVQGGINKRITDTLKADYFGTSKTFAGLNTTIKNIQGAINEAYQWARVGTVLSPYNSGDSVSISGGGALLTLGTATNLSTPAITLVTSNSGFAAPSNVGATSLGDKWVFWNSAGSYKGAIGFNSREMWFQSTDVSAADNRFRWFGGSAGVPVEVINIGDISGFVWNDTGAALDFRCEGDTDAYLLYLKSATNEACIGTNTPITGAKLSISGTLAASSLNTANGIVQTSATGLFSSSTALPNGTTATTQSPGDNSTKVATTAFVTAAVLVENFWDKTTIPLFYDVITPHTATDRIQVPTITGGGTYGGIFYSDLDGNKTLTTSSGLNWSGAGFILSSASPYIKIYDTAGDTHSGLVSGTTGDALGYAYHYNYVGAATLDLDAKPKDITFNSVMRFGYNTIALDTSFVFYNGKASYAVHPTFSADTEIVDKKYVDAAAKSAARMQTPEVVAIASHGQTVFTLANAPDLTDVIWAVINGVSYEYGVDFTISGVTLTWLNTYVIRWNPTDPVTDRFLLYRYI